MITISNERLEKLSEYDCADRYEVMSMATELLALRKEREKEESAVCPKCGNTGLADSGGVQPWGEPILIECDCTAPPAPGADDDSLPYDPQIAEYEQMMEAEQAQAGTTSQQFESLAGKAVVPEGWKLVPMRLTAENGAKGALSGEFSETKFVNCPECFGDDECETCDGSGRIEITVPVTWTTIKDIWAKGVEHFATSPQSPGNDHATVSGRWIPCSERMPPENTGVLVTTEFDGPGDWRMKWGTRVPGHPDAKSGWFIPGASWTPSHWQPLPEPPSK
ncbi:DUF551 domain-containing protein [Cronobacter sakazakii]|uniref:DUF551 domain-containing protein n=1 Tax=Cronobacter sakazakii TaxID=28141 RepID=UPI000AB650A1|nr:DUF551 domain-containing protein [Cronobacter sakazakii]MDK1012721.1 DUF551 domain-containing protein [Cronobacter sakazakii]